MTSAPPPGRPPSDPRSPQAVLRGVAETLAAHQPDTWHWLLAKHVADEDGRCEACRWASRGSPMWPCTLHFVAKEAERITAEHARRPPTTS